MSLNSRGTVRDLQEIPKDQGEVHTPSPLKGLEASGGDKAQTSEDSKTNQSQQMQTGKSDTGSGGGTESPRCWPYGADFSGQLQQEPCPDFLFRK